VEVFLLGRELNGRDPIPGRIGLARVLGQDYLARYTAPQARGAVGDEVLISDFLYTIRMTW
jgi:hypothetical protein